MALISCPECSKEISDKVKACPFCGYPFQEESETETPDVQKVEVSGVHLSVSEANKKRWFKRGLFVIAIALGLIAGIMVYQKIEAKRLEAEAIALEQTYHEEVVNILDEMVTHTAMAEKLLNLTGRVWQNAIEEEPDPQTDPYTKTESGFYVSDFNTALHNLYADEKTKKTTTELEESQNHINIAIKALDQTPASYEKVHDELIELNSAYQAVLELAINPTGSLYTFSTNRRDKVDKFNECRLKVEALLPDIKQTELSEN